MPAPIDSLSGGWPPTFPLFLLLQDRPCLILGGGEVARDKSAALLRAGAQVRVVGADLHEDFAPWIAAGRVCHVAEFFHPGQLDGVWLVVNTLEDPMVRQRVWQEAENRCIFLNTVDVHERCTAYWPALVQRPPVTVAIGTGGVSPALAGYLRQKIADLLPESLLPLAVWLTRWRQWVTRQLPGLPQRARLWKKLMEEGIVERFLSGDSQGAEEMIRQAVQRLNHTHQHH